MDVARSNRSCNHCLGLGAICNIQGAPKQKPIRNLADNSSAVEANLTIFCECRTFICQAVCAVWLIMRKLHMLN